MNGPEHYKEAERLLAANYTTKANIHAQLAQVAAMVDTGGVSVQFYPGPDTTPGGAYGDIINGDQWREATK